MHRLLVPAAELGRERPSLPPDALRHLKVVRPRDGEEVELFDGTLLPIGRTMRDTAIEKIVGYLGGTA